ncbi:MAG: 30S ribosome-binding factor RbfA [Bacteroidales bacterium]|jgi:ribosome-binding factor A|nr:30S ribosome-binding factor RbfA [Bacteroidales bacterium]
MTSTRQNKVARLIQRDLSDIFQKESKNLFNGALVSVTVVRVSPDLSFAKVYVSIFAPGTDSTEAVFELVQSRVKKIRALLAQRVAKQLRIIPELAFFVDDSLDYEKRIEDLLR